MGVVRGGGGAAAGWATAALGALAVCQLLAGRGARAYSNPDSLVVHLDDSTFHAFVDNSYDKPVLVEFYAPWCGHCKAFAPQYDRAATELKDVARFGAVDATAHRELAVAHRVRGYPTLVWFKKGAENHRHYQGPQTVAGVTHLVHAITSNAVTALAANADDVATFRKANPISYVLYISANSDLAPAAAAEEAFGNACGGLQDITDCAAVEGLPRSAVPDGLAIAAVRHETYEAGGQRYEVDPIVYPLDGTVPLARDSQKLAQSVKQWMEQFHLPLVAEVSGVNFGRVTRAGKVSVLMVCADDAMAAEVRRDTYATVHPVTAEDAVREQLPRFNFGTFVLVDERAEKYMEKFSISKSNLPQIVALDYERDRYYHTPGYAATAAGLAQFVRDMAADEIPERGLSLLATLDMKWEAAVRVLPFLSALDGLPRFTLIMTGVLAALALVFWSILKSDGGKGGTTAAPPKKKKKRPKIATTAAPEPADAEPAAAADAAAGTDKEHAD